MVTAKACGVTARHGRRAWACPASVSAVRFFEECAVFSVALCHRWAVFRRGCPPFTLRGLLVGRRLSPTVPTLAPLGVEPRGTPFGLGRSLFPCPVGGSIASDPLGWAWASALFLRSVSVFKVRLSGNASAVLHRHGIRPNSPSLSPSEGVRWVYPPATIDYHNGDGFNPLVKYLISKIAICPMGTRLFCVFFTMGANTAHCVVFGRFLVGVRLPWG